MGSGDTPKPITIKSVRFEPKRRKITTSSNTEYFTNGMLFIDAENSKPFPLIEEGGQIEFNGQTLSIVQVNELYTDQPTPHHLEVMLQ